jgi:hypothetical protein
MSVFIKRMKINQKRTMNRKEGTRPEILYELYALFMYEFERAVNK